MPTLTDEEFHGLTSQLKAALAAKDTAEARADRTDHYYQKLQGTLRDWAEQIGKHMPDAHGWDCVVVISAELRDQLQAAEARAAVPWTWIERHVVHPDIVNLPGQVEAAADVLRAAEEFEQGYDKQHLLNAVYALRAARREKRHENAN